MSIFKTIIGLLAGTFLKDIGDAFDQNFTTKEEKLKAMAELEQKYNERLKILAEINDHDSNSFLRSNVRPILCLIGMITISIIMVFNIEVDQEIKTVYMSWVGGMISFYFGFREYLKHKDRKSNKKS